MRNLAFGALHWHLFAQLYEHEFECFNAQYTALDACAELARRIGFPRYPEDRPSHAKRAAILCKCVGVPKPAWVKPLPGRSGCALSQRRNSLIHDAMYAGEPIGFAYPKDDPFMMLGLTAMVARIFLGLIGVRNEYTGSRCDTRQYHAFGMPA